jgi:hypothetical protein
MAVLFPCLFLFSTHATATDLSWQRMLSSIGTRAGRRTCAHRRQWILNEGRTTTRTARTSEAPVDDPVLTAGDRDTSDSR